jgi:hypothetical protein
MVSKESENKFPLERLKGIISGKKGRPKTSLSGFNRPAVRCVVEVGLG